MIISHFSVSDKITILVARCNFKCKYCFFKPFREIDIDVEKLIKITKKLRKQFKLNKIMIAGGEPTLEKDLPEFVKLLKENNFYVIISTNGYYLCEMLHKLEADEIHIDLKALDNKIHKKLTGSSNKKILKCIEYIGLRKNRLPFRVEVCTVYIPGIVEINEIRNIAKFLSKWDLHYRITGHVPVTLNVRRPTRDELLFAKKEACKYLSNVTSSLDFKRHKPSQIKINPEEL
ncbi:Radical SAM domain protein [Methanothermus fervidus DSM 2088]|uniref:Radical SAM domain protein n=1 Tax=Methanothermus fervidus (strain ATCC 43054 / DSM 2088 / JCM 10308 / V24 S) TaxID=523846 RepID=E3GX73_METFV|nr:radical SAM protein [Methanothermus fervidus]ADP78068.1 Radical SAM domain protein [Methanothermus fervidus DSM 2088]